MAKAPKTPEAPGAAEVFADGVATVAVRRNVARMTLVSDRVDPDDPDTSHRVVVGHVAMNLAGFLDLHARMQNIVDQMRSRGAVTPRTAPAGGSAKQPAAKKTAAKKTAAKKAAKKASGRKKA
jgi:hypothetical protein